MAVEARSFEMVRGVRSAFWRLWLFRLSAAIWLTFSGLALTAAQAQTACMYSVCNPWGSPPAYTAIGRTPISACTQGTARWIASSNVDVSLYGGYPKTEVCGGGSNCCINWPAGQQNYTWLCSGPCAPEITEENSCSTANPVQPGVGRKRLQETDYSGTSTHPLELTRFYSNHWTDGTASLGLSPIPAMDGGWRHNYQAAIKIRADGYIRAFRPDGRLLAFTADPSNANTWMANGGRETMLGLMDSAGQRSGYVLNAKGSDQVETYNAEGQLLSIKDRNGWLTTLTYSNPSTPTTSAPRPGLLLSVRNQFGRELKFVYDQAGRLAELIPPGASAGQPAGNANSPIRYRYNETSGLGVSTPAEDQLTSVVWQDGTIRRYHHEDDRWPRAVTGITAESNTRYSTYAYDSMGRVTRSELANGIERMDFSYGANGNAQPITTVTDYASGGPTNRTYTFTDIKGSRYPESVTAPCPTCGSTAQATQYDPEGRKTREVKHDGTVVFYAYDAAGRETERATFPLNYQSAGVRPALRFATSVTSTRWHTTWDLPTRITEPGRNTTYSYNARGITATSTSATTDATGAAKFGATLTGPVATTQYAYNANNLNTSVTELTNSVITQQWNLAYNALGDLTRITDVTAGNQSATISQYTPDGRVLRGTTDQGIPISITYSLRGAITQITRGTQTARFTYNTVGSLIQARTPDNQVIDYVLDANQAVVDIKLNGASVSAQMLALGDYPDSSIKVQIEAARQALIQSVEGLLRAAHAQVVVIGGGRSPQPPVFDPRTDMLMSPMSGPDKALRALNEAIARACRCDPNQGFGAPKFTAVTFAHVFQGGHVVPMFSDQSTFAPTEKVGQALVDEVARVGRKRVDGTRDIYHVNMGRVVGVRYDKDSASSDKRVPTQWITMIVERNNCSSTWRLNEVVTMYPDRERP